MAIVAMKAVHRLGFLPSGRLVLAFALALGLLALTCSVASGAFPGRNGRIAFGDLQGDDNNNFIVTSITPAGRRQRTITSDGGNPAYSPAGRFIAYEGGFQSGIWVKRASGRGRARRLTGQEGAADPDWSPSGKRLVFSRYNPLCPGSECYELWVHERGQVRRLIGGSDPAWSVRGEIAFQRDDGIYAIRPDGTGLRRIVVRGAEPDWSPDGRRIAFVALRQRGGQLTADADRGIATVRRSGGGLRRLTRGTTDSAPSFSPDGTRIVFFRDGGIETLMRMHSDGRHLKKILDDAAESGLGTDWQPLHRR